jgi:predicted AAA+ superfamily ATPase
LKESGIEEQHIIYLNLDKRGLRKIQTPDQLEKLIEEKSTISGIKYLFIDEIQNVTGFEEVINGFREDGEYSIFLTGSNSYLLSGELVTKLTGRYLEFELFTLSFPEYIGMKAFMGKPVSSDLTGEFDQYLAEFKDKKQNKHRSCRLRCDENEIVVQDTSADTRSRAGSHR